MVAMEQVKVTEVANSNHLEPVGMKRCLQTLSNNDLQVKMLATDQHIMTTSILKKEFPEIDHRYDVWHLAKNITEKLWAKARTKGCEDLADWVQSVSNHLWWCAARAGQRSTQSICAPKNVTS